LHFLWVSKSDDIQRLNHAFLEILRESPTIIKSGAGGVLIVGKTYYPGFKAIRRKDRVFVVLGDPLFSWMPSRKFGGAWRTTYVYKKSRQLGLNHEKLDPYHASIILEYSTRDGLLGCRTDGLGALPLYFSSGQGLFAISTSPDLLAATIGAELDTYSCAEFISQDRVTFPHTLYKGIQQVDPRVFLTANSSGFKAVQANVEVPAIRDSNELPTKVLSRITEDFWSRVKKN